MLGIPSTRAVATYSQAKRSWIASTGDIFLGRFFRCLYKKKSWSINREIRVAKGLIEYTNASSIYHYTRLIFIRELVSYDNTINIRLQLFIHDCYVPNNSSNNMRNNLNVPFLIVFYILKTSMDQFCFNLLVKYTYF